jgi:hypothetical protein
MYLNASDIFTISNRHHHYHHHQYHMISITIITTIITTIIIITCRLPLSALPPLSHHKWYG